MTQNGIVTEIIGKKMAMVSVIRGTACGGNCGNCEACEFNSHITVEAMNTIGAKIGERVVITSSTQKIAGITALIYLLPLFSFFCFYILSTSFHLSSGLCILCSFLGLIIGGIITVFIGRKMTPPDYYISDFLR